MRELMNRIEEIWCVAMHDRMMWPIHGKYRCRTCLREYAVGFEAEAGAEPAPGRLTLELTA